MKSNMVKKLLCLCDLFSLYHNPPSQDKHVYQTSQTNNFLYIQSLTFEESQDILLTHFIFYLIQSLVELNLFSLENIVC